MNPLRTLVTPQPSGFKITHSDVLMSVGSCFSESIGKKLEQHKFNIEINPFGQQYNPLSICNAMHRLMNPVLYESKDLFCHNELYHSFQHHSDFSLSNEQRVLEKINTRLLQASEHLKHSTHLFLTFGTAHAFRNKTTGEVVSNCHKLPASNFETEFVNPKIIFNEMSRLFEMLWKQNNLLKIILTVSPVRYFAYGVHENTVSKSYLHAAIQFLQDAFPQLYYFPAYELLMDDLRDYRFYADDMLHPSPLAIDYVWKQLAAVFFNDATMQLNKSIGKVNAAINHHPRNSESQLHETFLEETLKQITELEKRVSVSFIAEKETIIAMLGK